MTPSTITGDNVLLNYTSLKSRLDAASGVKGAVPRWMLPVNITFDGLDNAAIALMFDWELEKVIPRTKSWIMEVED